MKTVEQYKKVASFHPVTALKYLALTLAGFSCILPFVWVALSSVKPDREIYSNSFGLPKVWVWSNYKDAWKGAQVATSFLNSIFLFLYICSSFDFSGCYGILYSCQGVDGQNTI